MTPAQLQNAYGKVWLNIASSTYPLEHFANLDNHIAMRVLDYPFLLPLVPRRWRGLVEQYREARRKAPMFRHDCRKRLPLPDASVEHVLCSHFLEHVFPDEAAGILKDFDRVLKPGGTAHIIVPDIAAQIAGYQLARKSDPKAADEFVRQSLLSKPNRGSLLYRLLELQGGFGLQHRWMYDQASMEAKVKEAGFILKDKNDTPSAEWRKGDESVHVVAVKRF
ncbi:MAG: methyltransferase domain-containing protein [Rhizobiales bacterium]|nr:methyltransferase domain-containing protein [Hyphomicrobiales bacterium]